MRTIAIIVGSVIVVLGALTNAAPSIIQAMGVHKEYTGRRYELLGGARHSSSQPITTSWEAMEHRRNNSRPDILINC